MHRAPGLPALLSTEVTPADEVRTAKPDDDQWLPISPPSLRLRELSYDNRAAKGDEARHAHGRGDRSSNTAVVAITAVSSEPSTVTQYAAMTERLSRAEGR